MTTTENQTADAASPATTDLSALQQLPEQEAEHESSDPGCATTGYTARDDTGNGSAPYPAPTPTPTPAPRTSEEC